jgi:hypothetical protein
LLFGAFLGDSNAELDKSESLEKCMSKYPILREKYVKALNFVFKHKFAACKKHETPYCVTSLASKGIHNRNDVLELYKNGSWFKEAAAAHAHRTSANGHSSDQSKESEQAAKSDGPSDPFPAVLGPKEEVISVKVNVVHSVSKPEEREETNEPEVPSTAHQTADSDSATNDSLPKTESEELEFLPQENIKIMVVSDAGEKDPIRVRYSDLINGCLHICCTEPKMNRLVLSDVVDQMHYVMKAITECPSQFEQVQQTFAFHAEVMRRLKIAPNTEFALQENSPTHKAEEPIVAAIAPTV